MSRRSRIALGALLCIGACASPKPAAPSALPKPAALPPDAITERDVAWLLATLDERAKDRTGFTATYRLQAGDAERTIRFVYLAPDRARLDVRDGAKSITTCVSEAVTAIRAEGDGTSWTARYEAKELQELWADCMATLDGEFPSTTAAESIDEVDRGPTLEFEIRPDLGSSEHGELSLSVDWSEERSRFLSWLDSRAWDRAHFIDENRIEVSKGTKTATLSSATGMILDMKFGDRFHASLVESTDKVDPSEFAALTATAEAGSPSTATTNPLDADLCSRKREYVYRRILPAARTAQADPASFRRRAAPVMETLHRWTLKLHYRAWLNGYEKQLDHFVEEYSSSRASIGTDAEALQIYDRRVDDSRSSVKHSMAASRDDYVASLAPESIASESPSTLTMLWNIERDAARAAYDHEIIEPVLRHLDDQLKAIRDAK